MKVEMVTHDGDFISVFRTGEGIMCNPFRLNLAVSVKKQDGEPDDNRKYDTLELSLREEEVDMLISMLRG